jgi:hypothetical protein
MTDATTVISRKKRGPEPTGKGTPIMLRLHADLLDPIDKVAAEHGDLSRPEAVRLILREWLISARYVQP